MGDEGGEKLPDPGTLAFILQEARVPSTLRDAIYELGIQEIDDFAFAYKDDTALDALWPKLPQEAWEQVGVKEQGEQATSIAAGRIRKAWHMCKSASQQGIPTPSTPLKMEPGDWVENLPPKLTQDAVDAMVQRYKTSYPSEVLDGDSMPGIRLLSVVHQGLKTRLAWVPWQHRLSQKQYQEQTEARTGRPLRSEWQIITHALVDDQPEVPVEGRALSPGWFLKMQVIFSNALALCDAAHLKNLKLFDKKVADMCLKQPEKGSGLRTVTTTEMLAADRRLWSTISGLLAEKWSLDDALHEMTHIRSDVASLLMLRPILPTPGREPPLPPRKRLLETANQQQQPAKKTKGKGKGKGSDRPAIPANWDTKHGGKEICRRYQSNSCKVSNCKFAHVCAIKGCHQNHSAKDHQTPPNKT